MRDDSAERSNWDNSLRVGIVVVNYYTVVEKWDDEEEGSVLVIKTNAPPAQPRRFYMLEDDELNILHPRTEPTPGRKIRTKTKFTIRGYPLPHRFTSEIQQAEYSFEEEETWERVIQTQREHDVDPFFGEEPISVTIMYHLPMSSVFFPMDKVSVFSTLLMHFMEGIMYKYGIFIESYHIYRRFVSDNEGFFHMEIENME